jgi:hypothetical protein
MILIGCGTLLIPAAFPVDEAKLAREFSGRQAITASNK